MGAHLIDGEFQSDKYPTCPRGKVPLSVKDKIAQDLLWQYAQRRRGVDTEFSEDLERALLLAGYNLSVADRSAVAHRARQHRMLVGARVLLWVLALACVVGSVYLFLHPETGSTMTLPERERIQKLEHTVADLDKRVKELEKKEKP